MPEDYPIQVERSKALHELAESYKKAELDEKTGEQNAESSGNVSKFLYCFCAILAIILNIYTLKVTLY